MKFLFAIGYNVEHTNNFFYKSFLAILRLILNIYTAFKIKVFGRFFFSQSDSFFKILQKVNYFYIPIYLTVTSTWP